MQPRILFSALAPGRLELDPDASHHLVTVLRAKAGDGLTLFDGQGREAQAELVVADKSRAVVKVDQINTITRESPLSITVAQALCTGDKMDWVVQKSTELGATRIVPLAAARSVMKLDASRAKKRMEHWSAIARAAAAQCGRTVVPEISPIVSPADLIADWVLQPNPKTGWLLDPFAHERLSSAPLQGAVTLWIGPEAGWTDDEEALARSAGLQGIHVGPRILRTETAAAVVLAAIAMKCGEF